MKKNLRKIPDEITQKLRLIKSKTVVVGCAIRFKSATLLKGGLNHLGVLLTDKELAFPKSVIPRADQGRYSDRNVNGFEIIRKDLASFWCKRRTVAH